MTFEQTKKCCKCGELKPVSLFYRKKSGRYVDSQCKECVNARNRRWVEKNRDKSNAVKQAWVSRNIDLNRKLNREYAKKNKEAIRKRKRLWEAANRERVNRYAREYAHRNKEKIAEASRQWRANNPDKVRQAKKAWNARNIEKIRRQGRERQALSLRSDIKFNLNVRMTSQIRLALKGEKKGRGWESLVGYTVSDLKRRLKKTMPQGYSWDDYLSGVLHIDHKIPISAFNFEKPEDLDFKRCWALCNLQLLQGKQNIQKHAKLDRFFQPSFVF